MTTNKIPEKSIENAADTYRRKWIDFFRGQRISPPRAPFWCSPVESEEIISQAQKEANNAAKC